MLRAARRRHDRESSGHAAAPGGVAGALADALLTTDWRQGQLLAAVRSVVAGRVPWARRLVAAVRWAYPQAPRDRPRELRQFLTARSLTRRAVIRHRIAAPTQVVRMRWKAPAIGDLGELADFLGLDGDALDWFADRREINRHARDEKLRHYRYAWRPHRLIEAPKPRLLALQRRVLHEILSRVPVHPSVHGFVPGRGTHTFARAHTGQDVLISLDLRAFFTSITAARIYGLFRGIGYPEPVAHALTALTTTRTPAPVLRHAPAPHLAALLRQPHLPQGAPTSPALANLCAYRLDRRLSGLAARFGVTYGRYADDLAFSGTADNDRLIALTTRIVAEEGFRVHPHKTRKRSRSQRQELTGLVVNTRPAVPREEYDRLRATLHNAAVHGLAEANRDGHADFAAHLAGRVAWMSHRHPTRAAKLHKLLARALA
ncbi:reverse transcriptase family protein [Actinoplanes sp. Pm04-4]|uniref:RNA-directed DNA polymerase n=1 Tax=Paractinoplanes pyxinae TaxID=2997416 RepID=A0ABT4B327_9ACTN|nr:reverse transcriptase family protein [Actinoplanes pyxinae]MCY1140894.1 reverse transcriptase family protein [Actinoplanes pyxinae]